MMKANQRWIRVAIGLVITIFFLRLALDRLDFGRVLDTLAQINWIVLPLAVMCLAVGYAARVVRWWWMLRACNCDTKLHDCVWPLLIGVAINNVVPLRAGDFYRVMGFRQELRAPLARVVGTLFIERIFDVTVLLGFFFIGVARMRHSTGSDGYTRTAWALGVAMMIAWTVTLVAGKSLEGFLRRRVFSHKALLARRWSAAAQERIEQLFDALSLIRKPSRVLGLFAISLVIWGFEGAIFQIAARGLSYHGNMYGPWFAFSSGTLSTLMPSSPGYVGTFDYFTMSGLMEYGAPSAIAGAFAFIAHLLIWLPTTAIGMAYVVLATAKPKKLQPSATTSMVPEDKAG
jgi:glycosyltransferase 2 family protein